VESSATSQDATAGRQRPGPVVIAYDGSPAAEHAVREAGALLAGRPAVVVVVWKAGLGFEVVEPPTSSIGIPPASLDIRTALDVDRAMMERAERLAQKGAGIAHDSGFEAEGLAVADDMDTPVAETIVDVARERDAQALVVGAHGHGRLEEVLLGSTSREVIRLAPCPVVVVRTASPG
jgi:nucleotide-binding universal stress UspA family protein